MSVNRENVIWKAVNGTWNIGFYSFYDSRSYDDPEYDYEWDVEYDESSFWWASSGHPTPEAARAAYTRQHANPGGGMLLAERNKQDKEWMEDLDQKLWAFQNPREHAAKVEAEQKKAVASHNRAKRKAAKAFLEGMNAGRYVRVDFITNRLHLQEYDMATLSEEGDWLGFRKGGKFVRVYNTATKALHSRILAVESATRAPAYGYGYRFGGF